MAIKRIVPKSKREQFVQTIRDERLSGARLLLVGRSYGFSKAEIDQCVADAFNPTKGNVTCQVGSDSVSSAKSSDHRMDWLYVLMLPFVGTMAACGFLFGLVSNVCIAVAKTFKGEVVE